MMIARTIAEVRHNVTAWRVGGDTIALVPTMGMLHQGHLSLVRAARQNASRVIVSLFVNPTQFGLNEDFSRYPRAESADAQALAREGVDLMYAPSVEEIYPVGYTTKITVSGLDRRWEGEARPGHFSGVATVVAKLFAQISPDYALFGEKDYQQLQVIRKMVRDLDLPVTVVGCPTVRDEHGLALSSRNVYLNATQLSTARSLNRIMKATIESIQKQRGLPGTALEEGIRMLLENGFQNVDYLVLVDQETLEPVVDAVESARLLAAARIGGVRLLDNIPVNKDCTI